MNETPTGFVYDVVDPVHSERLTFPGAQKMLVVQFPDAGEVVRFPLNRFQICEVGLNLHKAACTLPAR